MNNRSLIIHNLALGQSPLAYMIKKKQKERKKKMASFEARCD
jgi:hypothetical protein